MASNKILMAITILLFISSVTLQNVGKIVLVISQTWAFPEQLSRPFMAVPKRADIQALVMSSFSLLWKATYTNQWLL